MRFLKGSHLNVTSASNVASSTAGQVKAEVPAIEVFEKDGQVMVSAPEGQTHVLADKHCYNCVTGFESLQSAARRGEDGGLFELAVKQTEERQKALGVVAQPGAGPLEGLTATGNIPQTEMGADGPAVKPLPPKNDTVNLSRTSQLRATGAEVASLTTARPSPPETSEIPKSDGPGVETHGPGDGHGHGAEVKAVAESKPASGGDDGHGHGADAKKERLADLERQLSESEQREVEELQRRDAEVRAHEQAHKSAGGHHAGAISLSFKTGPDGRKYAVGGEVPVDISPVKGDPEATIQKMQTIQRAALAPAEPSSADRRVAARAAQYANEARVELAAEAKEAPKKPGGKDKESSEANQANGDDGGVDGVRSEDGVAGAPSSPPESSPSEGGRPTDAEAPTDQRAEGGPVVGGLPPIEKAAAADDASGSTSPAGKVISRAGAYAGASTPKSAYTAYSPGSNYTAPARFTAVG